MTFQKSFNILLGLSKNDVIHKPEFLVFSTTQNTFLKIVRHILPKKVNIAPLDIIVSPGPAPVSSYHGYRHL